MKNAFVPGRAYNSCVLKMVISFVSVSANKMKSHVRRFRRSEKKPSIYADAVSEGLIDFFTEMGYPVELDHKK